MAKSLMSNIRAEMGKQDEKRGLAKLMSNVQEVQEVTTTEAEHLVRKIQDVQEDKAVANEHLIRKVQDVQDVQQVQHVQDVQDVQEVQGRNTQGRKGKKLSRAHISLSPEAYEYLSTMAGATRKTMSEYIENLLLEDKERTPSYSQIREFMKTMKGK